MSGRGRHRAKRGTSVNMIRPHMRDIPQFAFPEGFGIRTMRGDESALWTDVHRDSEDLFEIADDLFMDEFGDDLPATQERCYFIVEKRDNRQRQPPMNADARRYGNVMYRCGRIGVYRRESAVACDVCRLDGMRTQRARARSTL